MVWWPCTLRAIDPASWELHYDAKETHDFAAEVRQVTFTNARWVRDAGEMTHLRWRREGCDDDDDVDDADAPNDSFVVLAAVRLRWGSASRHVPPRSDASARRVTCATDGAE